MKEPMLPNIYENFHFSSFLLRVVSSMAVFVVFTATLCFGQNTPGLTMLADKAPRGAIVDEVTPDGPAARAGISVRDIITAVEGADVQSVGQIIEALARHKPGDTMDLTVAKAPDGTRTEVTMTLGANPLDASQAYMGLSVIGYVFLVPEGGTAPSQKQVPPGI